MDLRVSGQNIPTCRVVYIHWSIVKTGANAQVAASTAVLESLAVIVNLVSRMDGEPERSLMIF